MSLGGHTGPHGGILAHAALPLAARALGWGTGTVQVPLACCSSDNQQSIQSPSQSKAASVSGLFSTF